MPSSERRRAASLAGPGAGLAFDGQTLRRRAGVLLDLDGVAKGYALDRAGAALRRAGVDAAHEIQRFAGQRGPAPARVPVIRPFAPHEPDEPGGRPRPAPRGAAPDTTRGGRR